MTEDTKNIYAPAVLEFVSVANEYCKLVEQTVSFEGKVFIDKMLKLLSFLYLKTAMLPAVEKLYEEVTEKFVTEYDWSFVKNNIAKKLGDNDLFIEIPSTGEYGVEDKETINLAVCFADIYQDLKDFLTAYQIGNEDAMNDSLWECVENFKYYWGIRLLGIMNEFHTILYSENDFEDESSTISESDSQHDTDSWIISQRQRDWKDE